MFIVVRAKRAAGILCLTILAIGGMIMMGNRTLVPVFAPSPSQSQTYYIIDAGHGGEDGGAVSSTGTAESDINLSVAKRVEGTLSFLGKNTAMTRSDGQAVYSSDAVTLRQKKRSDLKNRAAMINGYDDALLISIHQNSLPSVPSVHGAQAFYNTVNGAQPLAAEVQQSLNEGLNIGNEKTIKKIDSTIYLMRQVDCPAILVECGFLSNDGEARLLTQDAYQKKLAVAIAAGVVRTSFTSLPMDSSPMQGTESPKPSDQTIQGAESSDPSAQDAEAADAPKSGDTVREKMQTKPESTSEVPLENGGKQSETEQGR